MRKVRRSASGKVAALALVGLAVVQLAGTILLAGDFSVLLLLVFELLLLVPAVLIAVGVRWAPAAAAVLGGLLAAMTLAGSGSRLSDPQNPAFVTIVLFVVLAVVVVTSGIRATLNNYRRGNTAGSE